MSTLESDRPSTAAYIIHNIPPFTSMGGMPLTPEREEIICKATAMVPALRERRMETNELRRLPDETVSELRASGLLNVRRPREVGGVSIDNQTYCDMMAELARGCGSTAWTVGIINDIWFLGGTALPAQGRAEFYATGETGTAPFSPRAGGTAKKVEGGWLLEGGEWPWASGSQLAGWVVPRIDLVDEDGSMIDAGVGLIPMSECEILDEWHMMAMRGSASNVVKIGELFIPDHRMGTMSRVLTNQHIPDMPDFQRQPWLTGVIFGLVPIAVGLARAAVELFVERSHGKMIMTTSYMDQAKAVRTHLRAAESAQKTDCADLLLKRGAATLDFWAATNHQPTVAERTKIRGDLGYASRLAREAVQDIFEDAGASALADSHPLSRIAADINAICMHGAFNPTNGLENYGATLLGQDPPAMTVGAVVYV